MSHVVIIGNGVSGITAARHIRKKSDRRITVISSESDYFFSRTALMYVFMGHMKFEHIKPYEDWFWEKNRIDLVRDRVTDVDPKAKQLQLEHNGTMEFDTLIIATGSKSRMLNWPGQDLKGVQGLYHKQDLESMEQLTNGIRKAVIAGGGLIGVEMAEMLHSRGIDVTMLILESGYWRNVLPKEESMLIGRHLESHGVQVMLNSEIEEIIGDDSGRVKAVKTKKGETLDCEFLGLTIGVVPNIDFLKTSGLDIKRGLLVDEYLRTNYDDIFAIGDCAEIRKPEPGRRAIEAVWYTGRMMGEVVAETICNKPIAYKPGVWFNSAKFFDIEYQTYGIVPPDLPDDHNSFYWEHSSGDKCLRLVYEKESKILTGINVFGIRLRHEICNNWINQKKSVHYVLENLKDANFDPEFYRSHEEEIAIHFNSEDHGNKVKVPLRKGRLKRMFS